MNEQWQMGRESAQGYERYVARYILGPWAPLLVDAAGLAAGERVLDVACGTGVVARVAAQRVGHGGHVIGIDVNPAMIDVARSLATPRGASMEWLERSALDLGVDDAAMDAVLCQQGLQFFPDKPLAMREMRRVLRAGGRLALSVWNSAGRYNEAVGDALARFVNADVADRFCASRKAPAREELEHLAVEAGFADVAVCISRINVRLPKVDDFALHHLAATPVASIIESADADTRRHIGFSVMTRLAAYADGEGVCYPEETYVMTATNATAAIEAG